MKRRDFLTGSALALLGATARGYAAQEQASAEPIYRNVWSLLREFGDAEVATLVAPRGLVVEHAAVPTLGGNKGTWKTPSFESVKAEFERIDRLTGPGFQPKPLVNASQSSPPAALQEFAKLLGVRSALSPLRKPPSERRRRLDVDERQRRQVTQLEQHVQGLVRDSEHVRERFFLNKVAPELEVTNFSRELRHKTVTPDKFVEGAKPFRQHHATAVSCCCVQPHEHADVQRAGSRCDGKKLWRCHVDRPLHRLALKSRLPRATAWVQVGVLKRSKRQTDHTGELRL